MTILIFYEFVDHSMEMDCDLEEEVKLISILKPNDDKDIDVKSEPLTEEDIQPPPLPPMEIEFDIKVEEEDEDVEIKTEMEIERLNFKHL
jgi:hypothetical protein